jgi:hypothetical protein
MADLLPDTPSRELYLNTATEELADPRRSARCVAGSRGSAPPLVSRTAPARLWQTSTGAGHVSIDPNWSANDAAFAAPPKRPRAVTVIGVIGIVLGSMGLTCLGAQSLFNIAGFAKQAQQMPPDLLAISIAMAVVGLGLSIFLLIGSIGTIKLAAWARPAMIVFAVIDLVFDITKLIVGVWMLPRTIELIRNMPAPSNMNAQQFEHVQQMQVTYGRVVGTTTMVVTFLVTAGYALAVLQVMRRPHVKAAFGGEGVGRNQESGIRNQ